MVIRNDMAIWMAIRNAMALCNSHLISSFATRLQNPRDCRCNYCLNPFLHFWHTKLANFGGRLAMRLQWETPNRVSGWKTSMAGADTLIAARWHRNYIIIFRYRRRQTYFARELANHCNSYGNNYDNWWWSNLEDSKRCCKVLLESF